MLDAAILRRFQKRICIDLPDVNARARIFRTHLGNTPNTLQPDNFRSLAEGSEKYSASDIGNVVQDAMMQPVRKVLEATHFKTVVAPSKFVFFFIAFLFSFSFPLFINDSNYCVEKTLPL